MIIDKEYETKFRNRISGKSFQDGPQCKGIAQFLDANQISSNDDFYNVRFDFPADGKKSDFDEFKMRLERSRQLKRMARDSGYKRYSEESAYMKLFLCFLSSDLPSHETLNKALRMYVPWEQIWTRDMQSSNSLVVWIMGEDYYDELRNQLSGKTIVGTRLADRSECLFNNRNLYSRIIRYLSHIK